MKKLVFKNTYVLYTITFLILLPIIFYPFLSEGKSFVWKLDGLDQHLPMLLYYGEMLRGLLSGQGFPMVDFKLGLGFDTISTLSYYVLGDPIALLSVFMTKKNSLVVYDFLILLRFYLAGISYIILLKFWKKDGSATAWGALIYVFSGFTLYSCLRHPFFMNPLIYLPLILVGVELVLRRKRPYLMVAMIFISAISNFYFFFILSVITVIYIVFRYFTQYRKFYQNVISGFLVTGLRTGGYYLLGLALAAFLFIPVVNAFMNNGRLSAGPKLVTSYYSYTKDYYISFIQGVYTTSVYAGYWSILSYALIIIVSFAILICNKKYWKFQIAYVLILIGLCVPAFGYFMNGFSYVTNRWGFVLGLMVAVTFRLTYENIFRLRKKEIISLLLLVALYGFFVLQYPSEQTVKEVFTYLLAVVAIVLILQTGWLKQRRLLARGIFYILALITLGANGFMLYSPHYSNYVNQYLSEKIVNKRLYKGVLSVIPKNDSSLYRVETYGDKALNEALNAGFNDVSGYFSLMDGRVTSYLKDLEALSQISAYRFQNLDNRTILDTLASVKYVATTDPNAAPYGYHLAKEVSYGKAHYYLYENEYALPIGYTYENYLPKDDYDRLSALEKQSAMLGSVILDEATDYAVKANQDTDYGITKLEATINEPPGIKLSDNQLLINKKRSAILLQFYTKPDMEVYVRLGNLTINKEKSISYDFYENTYYGVKKRVNVRNEYFNSYFGKENYLINTGVSMAGQQEIVLSFPKKQKLSYDNIEVYGFDMKYYREKVKALMQNTLTNITQSNNLIQGDITLDKKKVLVLSIPYGKGWSAYVDGEKKELLQANVMYMALPLETGSHHVVLKYETPYLKVGFVVSFAAFAIFLSIMLYQKRITMKKIVVKDILVKNTFISMKNSLVMNVIANDAVTMKTVMKNKKEVK